MLLQGPLFSEIPESVSHPSVLDVSGELSRSPIAPWTRLGVWSPSASPPGLHLEQTARWSMLAPAGTLSSLAPEELGAAGNFVAGLGSPTEWTSFGSGGDGGYSPFYQHFIADGTCLEPVVNGPVDGPGWKMHISRDMILYLGLEEAHPGDGTWIDPKLGTTVLRQYYLGDGTFEIVEIRQQALFKYLRARQMELLVAHFHSKSIQAESKEQLPSGAGQVHEIIRSERTGAVARISGHTASFGVAGHVADKEIHLYFSIVPPPQVSGQVAVDDWPFDVYNFTLPTSRGFVAPARFTPGYPPLEVAKFAGVGCDFMEMVYFRQAVLSKYETMPGFEVRDDGTVACAHYWGTRRASRLGDDFIQISIGDFAEGIANEEWSHWRQHAVDSPGQTHLASLRQVQSIPELVNGLDTALARLNASFRALGTRFGVEPSDVWTGQLESLAGRHLKFVYAGHSVDEVFLTRATLLSTFVIDELKGKVMRRVLGKFGPALHQRAGKTLGTRLLLQRLSFVATLLDEFHPVDSKLLARYVDPEDPLDELNIEVALVRQQIRKEMGALAFLYDLRVHGGLAHPPNPEKAGLAADKLGFPKSGWRRTHFRELLQMVTDSILTIAARLGTAAVESSEADV